MFGGLAGGAGASLTSKISEALGGHSGGTKSAMKLLGVTPAKTFMDGLKVGMGGGASECLAYSLV